MDITKFFTFNLISKVIIKEKFGPYILTIQPSSLCKFDKTSPTNRFHSHLHYELCFVIQGKGEYIHGNKTYILKKGDIFISDPKVGHEIRLKKNCDSTYSSDLHLIFFNVKIESISSDYTSQLSNYEEKKLETFLKNHNIVVNNQDYLVSYIDFLSTYIQTFNIDSYGMYKMVRTMALEALFSLCNDETTSNYNNDVYCDTFNNLLLYIESNIDKPITIDDMAKVAFTSPRNVHYMFKKYYNKTPKDYINERKVNLAKVYLKMNYKVTDVGTLIGIHDLGQFSRLFKKYSGVSPKQFQNLEII